MTKLLNIIEMIRGKYQLKTDLLKSSLTLAENCDNIALISIVGPKSHGKTFFINCLINYINSQHKDEWPHSEDELIQMDLRQQSYGDNITPVIKLTSSPFIIKDEIENEVIETAVFLMDSDFVFDNEMSSQQVQDIITLFLQTSSTVIYNHKQSLPEQEFSKLETIISKISNSDNSLDSLKNIVFLIRDWSPEKNNYEFGYGLYEGSKYIKNFIKYQDKSYQDLNCFLMSTPELDRQTEVIRLSELNKPFLFDLKNLIDLKLYNIEEMSKKRNPNTNEYIKASELFELFENCTENMNINIDNNISVDNLSVIMNNLKIDPNTHMSENKIETNRMSQEVSTRKNNMTENNLMDTTLNTNEMEESNRIHSNECHETMTETDIQNNVNNGNNETVTKSEIQNNENNETVTEYEIKNNETNETVKKSEIKNNETNETVTEHEIQNNETNETVTEHEIQNNETNETVKKSEIKNNETNETVKKSEIKNNETNETVTESEIQNNETVTKSEIKNNENNETNEAIKTCRNNVEVKLNKTNNQYEETVKQILSLYKQNLKSSIINQIKDDLHIIGLSHIQSQCKKRVFKEKTVEFNGNIEKEFLTKLDEKINQINRNLKTLFNHYRAYETERQQFSNMKYYSEEMINEFYCNQKSKISDSIQKFKDSYYNELIESLMEKSFNALKDRNKFIEKEEQDFAIDAIDVAFEKYKNCFEAKLKTRIFERNEVNNIRDQLLKYTIKQLIASCNFNDYQKYLVEKCEQILTSKVEEYEEKVDKTKDKLTETMTEAFKIYYEAMNAKVLAQKKSYLKSNEFTELHHKYSEMAIESFNQSAKFLNQDYSPEFANEILLEYQSILRKRITDKKRDLKTLNKNNTSDAYTVAIYLGKQHIMAATHRNNTFEIIFDKLGQKLIPNSISFGDQILIGTEAKNHYENLFPNTISFKNFDIKQLLGKERSDVSNEELSEFPFTFLRDKLYVNVNYHDLRTDLSIETLLAFMILDIKSCAEKQIGNIMSNIVLTVPTNYTMNQKNAIRNTVKIAGLEDCNVISEISAAAISYAVGRLNNSKKFTDIAMFIIINDYECDVAICSISNKKVEYKVFFHQALNSTEEKKKSNSSKKSKSKKKPEDYNNTELNFVELIGKALKESNLNPVQIDECVIAGNSRLITEMKIWMNNHIKQIPSMICNSLDIVIKGCAIYGEMLANKINIIEISELTTHDIYLNLDTKYLKVNNYVAVPQNTALPTRKIVQLDLHKSSDLPLKMVISQDNQIVTTLTINALPFFDCVNQGYDKHLIEFEVDSLGQIYITSFLTNRCFTPKIKLELIKIHPGLNDKNLAEEKRKLCSLTNKIREEIKINEEKLCLREDISKLTNYCSKIQNEVEKNLELRPLIKKRILSELESTQSFVSGKHLDLNEIKNRKQLLDKALEVYMQR